MIVGAASVVVAILSIIVAIYFGSKNQQLNRENAGLQRRLVEIEDERRAEEKAALLTAQLYYDGKRRVLRIWNKGNGEARNIQLRIDGLDATEHPCWVKQQHAIWVISGGNHADCLLSMTMRDPRPQLAEAFWDDDVGQGKSSRSTLTL